MRWTPRKQAELASWMLDGFSIKEAARGMGAPLDEARDEWSKIKAAEPGAKRENGPPALTPPPRLPAPPEASVAPSEPLPDPEPAGSAPPKAKRRPRSLKAARDSGDIAGFVAEREGQAGDAAEFDRLLGAMCEAAPLEPGELLARCVAYMADYPHLTDTQFGVLAAREPGLLATLRVGRRPRPAKEAEILEALTKPPPFNETRGSSLARKARESAAATVATARAAQLHRLTDPLESAKRHLQRQGFSVFSGRILDPPKIGWIVGRKPDPLSDDELFAMARRLGWSE